MHSHCRGKTVAILFVIPSAELLHSYLSFRATKGSVGIPCILPGDCHGTSCLAMTSRRSLHSCLSLRAQNHCTLVCRSERRTIALLFVIPSDQRERGNPLHISRRLPLALLRCPIKSSGLRFSSILSTAATRSGRCIRLEEVQLPPAIVLSRFAALCNTTGGAPFAPSQ